MEKIIVKKCEDGQYQAFPTELKDLIIGVGGTPDEAKDDLFNSYTDLVEYYKERYVLLRRRACDTFNLYADNLSAYSVISRDDFIRAKDDFRKAMEGEQP